MTKKQKSGQLNLRSLILPPHTSDSKIGRNQPCPCGSGAKYKRCHGKITQSPLEPFPKGLAQSLARHKAEQMIREQQQGFGRPIVAAKMGDQQVVAVRNKVYYSPKWKTVADFLTDYLKNILDPAWGNAEITKPFSDRHPVVQWYDEYCRYQQQTIKTPGVVHSATVTGIVACYMGLAYSLYLIDHNVELQDRLVCRLKDPAQFQGAYYELMVANVLIRAGFELTLEDETDRKTKHCEFAAVSKHTGKKYWVEAKARSVAGLMGKTTADGGSDKDPLSKMIPHLNAALEKPAFDERLIFIDLNAEMPKDVSSENRPEFIDKAIQRLERYESKELVAGKTAYVFITNMPFHRSLQGAPTAVVAPFGLGMSDFNRSGMMRLSERYRQDKKHSDAIAIAEAFPSYLKFPSTFDGSLPSEAFAAQLSRVVIGHTYFFNGIGEHGTLGTVTTATVSKPEKVAYIAITTPQNTSLILKQPMTDAELTDYQLHGDAYFGQPRAPQKEIKMPYDMFQWLMQSTKGASREKILEWFGKNSDLEHLKNLNDDDLHMEYCEALTMSAEAMKHKAPNRG